MNLDLTRYPWWEADLYGPGIGGFLIDWTDPTTNIEWRTGSRAANSHDKTPNGDIVLFIKHGDNFTEFNDVTSIQDFIRGTTDNSTDIIINDNNK